MAQLLDQFVTQLLVQLPSLLLFHLPLVVYLSLSSRWLKESLLVHNNHQDFCTLFDQESEVFGSIPAGSAQTECRDG